MRASPGACVCRVDPPTEKDSAGRAQGVLESKGTRI